ncbi:MAG: hypothetical protein ACOYNB_08665 [Aquabacterium sp.]|uniref:hypothetical protein n=1 Tax=Aquabacterium sp. TaxID=1872578 RepID=UPI003BC33BF7
MPFEQRKEPVSVWTIAMGVMLGMLFAHAIEFAAGAIVARYQIVTALESMQKDAERMEREQRQRAQIEQDAKRNAAMQREDAMRQANEAAQRKEAAWKAYFTPAAVCSNPPDTATFTKCANDHLRAKTQFEATYKP